VQSEESTISTQSPAIDRIIGKLISRKFCCWVTGTILLISGCIDVQSWIILTGLYLGSETTLDAINKNAGG